MTPNVLKQYLQQCTKYTYSRKYDCFLTRKNHANFFNHFISTVNSVSNISGNPEDILHSKVKQSVTTY